MPEAAAPRAPVYRSLLPGDRMPPLVQASNTRPRFAFDTLAGRYHLYGFFLSLESAETAALVRTVLERAELFDNCYATFTGVSIRRADAGSDLVRLAERGRRFAWDFDYTMAEACGATPIGATPGAPTVCQRRWILVDPSLHVLRVWPMTPAATEEMLAFLGGLPAPDGFGGIVRPAPVLVLPNVLEPGLCRALVEFYDSAGGAESGVHRAGAGVLDASFKRRKDAAIEDPGLLGVLRARLMRRVLPEIERLFFMRAHHVERHIVGCYAAEDGGHFAPHRDNSPGLTAHRRFAVSINLTDDFDGGEVVFPEYNTHGYKAPAGWAVVFPCAALHMVRQVTRGARYAYLPFVYDDAGRRIREAGLAAELAAS